MVGRLLMSAGLLLLFEYNVDAWRPAGCRPQPVRPAIGTTPSGQHHARQHRSVCRVLPHTETTESSSTRLYSSSSYQTQKRRRHNTVFLKNPRRSSSVVRAAASSEAPPPPSFDYPRSKYNGPVLFGLVAAAVTALLLRDALAIVSLYQNDYWMEADWVPESLKLLARLPADALTDYRAAALANPVFVKACTSGVSYLVGDLVAQAYEGRREVEALDLTRMWRNAASGFALHGPVLHAWIEFLEGPCTALFLSYYVGHVAAGTADVVSSAAIVVAPGSPTEYALIVFKIVLDQTLFALSFNTIYAIGLGVLARKSIDDISQGVKATLLPSIYSSWRFWPAVHLISYSPLVPTELKLLWIDFMEIFWVAILSFIANDDKQTATEPDVAAIVEEFDVQPAVEIVLARHVEKHGDYCALDYAAVDLRSGGDVVVPTTSSDSRQLQLSTTREEEEEEPADLLL